MLLSVSFLFCSLVNVAEAKITYNSSKSNHNTPEKVYRKTAAGEGAMTKKMIESCIFLKQKIDTMHDNLLAEKNKLEKADRKLQDIREKINNDIQEIDETDQVKLNTLKSNVVFTRLESDKHGVLADKYSTESNHYQLMVHKFTRECNLQFYFEDDYEEVSNNLGYGM